MTKRDLINQIRSDYSREENSDRTLKGYARSIKELAEGLYTKDTHFIFELIQNAEDNAYASNVTPTLKFRVTEIELEGKHLIALIIENNENGFQNEHVDAICRVGSSSKKKSQGYIGEKGIGFKSVFKITFCPYIFSNRFHFALPEKDQETSLGYIVPKWVDDIPNGINPDWTTIILPIKDEASVEKVITGLIDIAPETILFLTKLRSIEIEVSLPNQSYKVSIEKEDQHAPLIELTYLKTENNCEEIKTTRYWLKSETFNKPQEITHEKREGITERIVSVALPLEKDSSQEKLFSYLPVWEMTGIPFLINADFLLVSSREGIREDEEWNKWLRGCIAPVYKSAFVSALKSKGLSNEQKPALYATIPLKSSKGFLEPLVEQIQESLKEEQCVQTLPEGVFALPSKTRLAPAIRKLLNIAEGYPDYFKEVIHLVHVDIETFSKQLKAIGAKQLLLKEFFECLKDVKWLKNQSFDWLMQLYRYMPKNKYSEGELGGLPIIPIEPPGELSLNLSCDAVQPIYFSCDESECNALDSVPDWLSHRVPVAFVDSRFMRCLEEQEDRETLKKW